MKQTHRGTREKERERERGRSGSVNSKNNEVPVECYEKVNASWSWYVFFFFSSFFFFFILMDRTLLATIFLKPLLPSSSSFFPSFLPSFLLSRRFLPRFIYPSNVDTKQMSGTTTMGEKWGGKFG